MEIKLTSQMIMPKDDEPCQDELMFLTVIINSFKQIQISS